MASAAEGKPSVATRQKLAKMDPFRTSQSCGDQAVRPINPEAAMSTAFEDQRLGNFLEHGSFDFYRPTGRITANGTTRAASNACAEPFLDRFAGDPNAV